ncbi:MAG: segregation/condensation protein A, partial [Nitrospinota bacterium]
MTEYKVKLDMFEGPLDLLLHLIKEQELNIYDIPLAKITRQYFEYIDMLRDLNLEIVGEFLVMAATLTHIKSRMLLPQRTDEEGEEDGTDPRRELVVKLLEYKKYKEAASSLRERESQFSTSYPRSFISEWDEDDAGYLKEVSVFQLLNALYKVLKNSNLQDAYEVTLEHISVTEKMNEIMERLSSAPRLRFEDLFEGVKSKSELIGAFLAILELMKQWMIRVFQEKEFDS